MSDREVLYYDFDDFRLDLQRQRLLKNGEPLQLAPKAFQTLRILVQNAGRLVTKEQIYQELWADSFVEEANLTQYIYLLRKILDKNSADASFIETIARRGYMFTARVEKIFAAAAAVGESAFGVIPPAENASRQNEKKLVLNFSLRRALRNGKSEFTNGDSSGRAINKPGKYSPPARLFISGVLLLTAFVLALFGLGGLNFQTGKPLLNTASKPVASVAVLPFQPVDDESREGKLGLGMAEAVITRLSKLPQIPLRLTTAVFRYTDKPASNSVSAGRELGVDTILEGTVEQTGERVRVFVRLINVSDGESLWAETYDENFTDILAIQDSIARQVVQFLGLEPLLPEHLKLLQQHPTEKPEALEAYWRGLYFWNVRSKENLLQAATYFQKAVEIDPKFARAFAMLADTYYLLGFYRYANRDEMYYKASFIAAESLSIDDSIPEGHIALAAVQQFIGGDDEAAKRSLERSIELGPYNSTARTRYAWLLLRAGRVDDAVSQIRAAREYDPLSPVSNGAACTMLTFRENFAEAIKVCQQVVELFPNAPNNRLVLANAYFFNGDEEEALAQAKIEMEIIAQNKYTALGSIGYFYAKMGRRDEAEAIVSELKPEVQKDDRLYNDLALITHALGRREESLAYFRKAIEKKVIGPMFFYNDPSWKDLREDSRFDELMKDSEAK